MIYVPRNFSLGSFIGAAMIWHLIAIVRRSGLGSASHCDRSSERPWFGISLGSFVGASMIWYLIGIVYVRAEMIYVTRSYPLFEIVRQSSQDLRNTYESAHWDSTSERPRITCNTNLVIEIVLSSL